MRIRRGMGDGEDSSLVPYAGQLGTANDPLTQAFSDLANLPSKDLSTVLATFTMGGNPLVPSQSPSTSTLMLIAGGLILAIVLLGGKR